MIQIYREVNIDNHYNKHYVRIDTDNLVIHGFSDAFGQPQSTDICINEQGGYQFRLSPGGDENPPLRTEDGIPLYIWDGSTVQRRTDAEIEADRQALPKPDPVSDPITRIELALAELAGIVGGA